MCVPKAESSSVPVVAGPAEATRTKCLSLFCIWNCNANKGWIICLKEYVLVLLYGLSLYSEVIIYCL